MYIGYGIEIKWGEFSYLVMQYSTPNDRMGQINGSVIAKFIFQNQAELFIKALKRA